MPFSLDTTFTPVFGSVRELREVLCCLFLLFWGFEVS